MSRGTREHLKEVISFSPTGLSPSMVGSFQRPSAKLMICNFRAAAIDPVTSHNPGQQRLRAAPDRFGLFRVRSPLLTESLLFSLPAGTEMVHFPAFASTEL